MESLYATLNSSCHFVPQHAYRRYHTDLNTVPLSHDHCTFTIVTVKYFYDSKIIIPVLKVPGNFVRHIANVKNKLCYWFPAPAVVLRAYTYNYYIPVSTLDRWDKTHAREQSWFTGSIYAKHVLAAVCININIQCRHNNITLGNVVIYTQSPVLSVCIIVGAYYLKKVFINSFST